ncbi:MAG: DUF2125 domain-containing protein [Alphaproteobacteria bacterium]|jgi:hypothetical protein|nr:DUF2125 domain-containing protein [Alphaproteobacteria bacterium]MDP6819768.1 DUF2125 domain-containing protein [Alphaproteobacteria bacterium]
MKPVILAASVVGGIAIAVVAYTAYWFVAAGKIEDRIAEWAADQRARGITVEAGAPEVSGYPLHFEVALQRPSVDNSAGGWTWHGDVLTASFRPWRFDEFDVKFEGVNDVRFFDGDSWHDLQGRIEDGSGWLRLDGERRIENMMIDFKRIAVVGPWGEDSAFVTRLRARARRTAQSESDEAPEPSEFGPGPSEFGNAALELEGVKLPPGFGEEMGEDIEFLNFDISLFGRLPSGDTQTAVMAWRDEGGVVELNSFRIRWGPLGIETAGTIALDGEMRPIGALTADIIGYGDIIDALIMSNVIPLGDAFLAKVAFNMMADKPEDGGPPVLRSVPVMAQDGGLFIGPVAVANMPVIEF